MRRLAIATGTTGFLIIGFDAAGNLEVGNETHIAAVDAHAERIGGHRDASSLLQELVLGFLAFLLVHAAVIGDGLDAPFIKHLGHFLDLLSRGAVDDARLPLSDDVLQSLILVLHLLGVRDVQREIRPREAAHAEVRIAELEMREDVSADFRRGGGCEGKDLRAAQLFHRLAQAQIIGPEVMPPLRETVRLIHREQGNLHLPQRGNEHAAAEAFRCDVDEFVFAAPHPGDALLLFIKREGAVDQRRGDAPVVQGIDLILHQRDQRADNDGHAVHHHGRKLVAKRFSPTGGHDNERVLTRENGRNDLLLPVKEGTEAEVTLQRFAGIMDGGLFGRHGGRVLSRDAARRARGSREKGNIRTSLNSHHVQPRIITHRTLVYETPNPPLCSYARPLFRSGR